jgi:hypothetical protein
MYNRYQATGTRQEAHPMILLFTLTNGNLVSLRRRKLQAAAPLFVVLLPKRK